MPDAAKPAHPTAETDIALLLRSDHPDPFGFLGPHEKGRGLVIRSFQPSAKAVDIVDAATGEPVAAMGRTHPDGLFEAELPRRDRSFRYKLRIEFPLPDGTQTVEDPYRFGSTFGEIDIHLLGEGTHLRNYEKLGAHPATIDGVAGTVFAVWAPSARRVSVVGDFNRWDGRLHPMRKLLGIGVWEIFLPHIGQGACYKFEIRGPHGNLLPLKADPYAFRSERSPATASMVHGLFAHDWQDAVWMDHRGDTQGRDAPIAVYEVHLGSWMRVPEDGNRFPTYAELGDRLIPYVQDLGFTHIELLPVSEFPFDGSWGYQPIGLYAATSRFGAPEELAAFVDRCHAVGLGVLIDWVPGHFPTDAHGLGLFDGTHLYEHADPRQGFHLDWNTLIYNYGRREVLNFLLGNALYWMERFHIDGLRVDAVASMLYLDYSRKAGEWIPNQYGGRENIEAIEFLRRTNQEVFGRHPGATTVAEESTAWPAVSRPVYAGGLGFGYKWNMGWMNDTLRYVQNEPVHRRWHHHDMTFGLLYAFSENFILPISHDEVVHGKGSMIRKMPGDDWQKFANLRAYYGFMWTHPGKKLLFMGCEFAQWDEWNHDRGLDWHLLDFAPHQGMQRLVRDLNTLYRGTPALHQLDCDGAGFEWVEASDNENSVYAWLRKGRDGTSPVLAVCNFTPVVRHGYRVGVPLAGRWIERLNTDAALYGGSDVGNAGGVETEPAEWHGRPHSLRLTLPPLATVVFEHAG